ncbi:hypothetical protein F5X68DRAFT_266729 [Plectosphaerella plurivora]|uniref:Glycosyltransferase family 31 protein n=1 Tax=Plectosphaerella plurivora TaxID=936078 RepID=A0A9P9AFA3_9PEZI|nr:hypothetical protein F5X68DRAFT_266729 [Plectosphaerella plurivora]
MYYKSRRILTVVPALVLALVVLFVTSGLTGGGWQDSDIIHVQPAAPPAKHGKQPRPGPANIPAPKANPYPECAGFPDTSRVLVVMKTGASEAYARVPTQLMTLLRCLPDFDIYSDLEETIAGHFIHDSLDKILNETRIGNGDFDLYRHQQACAIDQETCNSAAGDVAAKGWSLDKYKNVHIAEKVYAAKPEYDWYLFIDADSYVLFHTVVEWLKHLDPTKPQYIGSQSFVANFPFAHGGSGYLVSQAAMRGIAESPGLANSLEEATRHTCCGDWMFAKALYNTSSIKVNNVWPVINGEKPATLPFTKDSWCRPLATMHHMSTEEISTFWEWESARMNGPDKDKVTRHADVFRAFVEPRLVPHREDWNNLSNNQLYLKKGYTNRKFSDGEVNRAKKEGLSEVEMHAHESFEDCAGACAEESRCLQFRYNDGLCQLGWSISLGRPMKRELERKSRWMSGWNLTRIEDFVREQGPCGEVEWPL